MGKGTLRALGGDAGWLTQFPWVGFLLSARTLPRRELVDSRSLTLDPESFTDPQALALGPGSLTLSPESQIWVQGPLLPE